MSESLPALNRDEFEGMLRAAERSYWDKHPFHQRMDAGELDPAHLRAWVTNRWYYQRNLPQRMPPSSRTARCPTSAGGGCHESHTTTARQTVTAGAPGG